MVAGYRTPTPKDDTWNRDYTGIRLDFRGAPSFWKMKMPDGTYQLELEQGIKDLASLWQTTSGPIQVKINGTLVIEDSTIEANIIRHWDGLNFEVTNGEFIMEIKTPIAVAKSYEAANINYFIIRTPGVVKADGFNTNKVGFGRSGLSVFPNPSAGMFQILTYVHVNQYAVNDKLNIAVYDLAGRFIRNIVSSRLNQAGSSASACSKQFQCKWDGIDGNGVPITAGHYIVKADFGRETVTKQISVLR